MIQNKRVLFQQKPAADFPLNLNCFNLKYEFISLDIPLKNDEILIQNLFISIDPVMKVWLSQAKTYYPALKKNDPMHCFAIAKVIKSANEDYKPNQLLFGNTGVQEYAIVEPDGITIQKIAYQPKFDQTYYINIFNNGFTAYFGIELLDLTKDSTLVVSTAAGATGFLVCQIAKIRYGCKVIGLTGTDQKCEKIKSLIQIDGVLNYKHPDFRKKLRQICNKGVDAYFDNVGEEQLDQILRIMNNFGRVALCGAMSSYKDFQQRKGLPSYQNIVSKRIKMTGFNFAQFYERFEDSLKFFEENIENKKIIIQQDIYNGIDQYYDAVRHLFMGNNFGKVLVNLISNQMQQCPKL